jgi:energy-coupling factor transporter ATP-binding protein EcfA2
MASIGNVFSHPSIIIGGRRAVFEGKKPHLATLVPETIFPRRHIINQIRTAIKSGHSVIVLGLPGIGKSTIIKGIMQKLGVPKSSYIDYKVILSTRINHVAFVNSVLTEDFVNCGHPIFVDDIPTRAIADKKLRSIFSNHINRGRQFIFSGPAGHDSHYAELVRSCGNKNTKIYVLPPAGFNEFKTGLPNHPITQEIPRRLFQLSGGSFRIINELLLNVGKTDKWALGRLGQAELSVADTLLLATYCSNELSYIYNNFENELSLLFDCFPGLSDSQLVANNLKAAGLSARDFWGLSLGNQQRVLRWIKYGLLKIDGENIDYRGELIKCALIFGVT